MNTRVFTTLTFTLLLTLAALFWAAPAMGGEAEQPEIDVTGNSTSIESGDSTPSEDDDTDFGSAAVGGAPVTRVFTIHNNGSGALNLTGTPRVEISGDGATHFSVTDQPASPVVSGEDTSVEINFQPMGPGTHTATVTIANNDSDEDPYTFAIQGTGVSAADPAITSFTGGSHFVFNNERFTVGYELTLTQPLTISTLGFYDQGGDGLATAHEVGIWNLSRTLLASATVPAGTGGTLADGFRYVEITPVTLPPGTYRIGALVLNGGGSDSFIVSATDTATHPAVTYVRGMSIHSNDLVLRFPTLVNSEIGLPDQGAFGPNFQAVVSPDPYPVTEVSGNGVAIALNDSTPSTADHTDFGTVETGTNAARTFTIANTGTAALDMNGSPRVAVSGTHAAEFSVTTAPAASVEASDSTTFVVTFTPTGTGTRTATLSIPSNDLAVTAYSFAIQGTGAMDTTPPETTITSGPPGVTNSTSATIEFTSNEPGTFEGRLDSGVFGTVTSPVNLTTVAEGTHTYEVRAKDAAGNVDPSPASVTWIVDRTAPMITTPGNIEVETTSLSGKVVTFSLGASDAVDTSPSVVAAPPSGTRFPIGTTTVNVTATDDAGNQSTASFTVTVNLVSSISQEEFFTEAGNGSSFGHAVAVDGDTMVVGASRESSFAGAAYVFVRDGTNWTQQARLTASNGEGSDNFGVSVAISGDTIVVGADLEDSSATGVDGNQSSNGTLDSGAVYVFVRNGTTWTQQAYLKGSAVEGNRTASAFGFSVAIEGDTVAVGSPNTDGGGAANNGAVYVFVRDGVSWSQQAMILASNPGTSDHLGWSMAISGGTIIAGAEREDSITTGVNTTPNDASGTEFDAGAAYVFVRTGTSWSQQAYLKASNTGAADRFGWSVAISGDTAVVGARTEDSGGAQNDESLDAAGAAYVFVRDGTDWSQQAYLKASNPGAGDEFGWAVGIFGDAIVVGARNEDSNATGIDGNQNNNLAENSGAAYAFVRAGTSWSQQAYIKAHNMVSGQLLGHSIAFDGATTVAGAPSANNGVGAVYVFTGVGPTDPQIVVEQPPGTAIAHGGGRDFGTVSVGGSSRVTFTIKNAGFGALGDLVIASDSTEFVVDSTGTGTGLTHDMTTTFEVTFVPTAGGPRGATIQISSNDPDDSPFSLLLTGSGTLTPLPEIEVEGPDGNDLLSGVGTIHFGRHNPGLASPGKTFTIRNTGTDALTLGVNADGAHPGDFIIGSLGSTALPGGGSTTFTVTFNPGAAGNRSATLRIANNDGNENPFSIPVTGSGNATPTVTRLGAATIEVEAGDAFTDPGATANDAEDGPLTPSVSGSVDTLEPGTYALTYTATDSGGLTASVERTVIVADTLAPVLTLLGDAELKVALRSVFTDPGATALDQRDGTLAPTITANNVNTNVVGTYQVTWSATDEAGLTGSATRTVIVVDPNVEATGRTFTGIVFDEEDDPAGTITVSVLTVKGLAGTFTGNLMLGTRKGGLTGRFVNGNFGGNVTLNTGEVVSLTLTLGPEGDSIEGSMIEGADSYSVTLDRAAYTRKNPAPASRTGRFTVLVRESEMTFTPNTSGDPVPGGSGSARIKVSPSRGTVVIIGETAEGAKVSASTYLVGDGSQIKFTAPVFSGGQFTCHLDYEDKADSDIDGTIEIRKPAQSSGLYAGGYEASGRLMACRYTSVASGVVPPFTDTAVIFSGTDGVIGGVERAVTITGGATSSFAYLPLGLNQTVSLSIKRTYGTWTISHRPLKGSGQKGSGTGVFYQKAGLIEGALRGPASSGPAYFEP